VFRMKSEINFVVGWFFGLNFNPKPTPINIKLARSWPEDIIFQNHKK
jgi:hypothetical protein